MDEEKYITLNSKQIEKFNEYSCNLGTLKYAFYIVIEYIENKTIDTINTTCLLYIVYTYIENLKKNFTEFLKDCDILA